METKVLKIVAQDELKFVPSRKTESGQVAKRVIRLKDIDDYGDEFLCTVFGNLAQCNFYAGDVVAASLRFQTREASGAWYQDIICTNIVKLSNT